MFPNEETIYNYYRSRYDRNQYANVFKNIIKKYIENYINNNNDMIALSEKK